jgi:hypothetical protein
MANPFHYLHMLGQFGPLFIKVVSTMDAIKHDIYDFSLNGNLIYLLISNRTPTVRTIVELLCNININFFLKIVIMGPKLIFIFKYIKGREINRVRITKGWCLLCGKKYFSSFFESCCGFFSSNAGFCR